MKTVNITGCLFYFFFFAQFAGMLDINLTGIFVRFVALL